MPSGQGPYHPPRCRHAAVWEHVLRHLLMPMSLKQSCNMSYKASLADMNRSTSCRNPPKERVDFESRNVRRSSWPGSYRSPGPGSPPSVKSSLKPCRGASLVQKKLLIQDIQVFQSERSPRSWLTPSFSLSATVLDLSLRASCLRLLEVSLGLKMPCVRSIYTVIEL